MYGRCFLRGIQTHSLLGFLIGQDVHKICAFPIMVLTACVKRPALVSVFLILIYDNSLWRRSDPSNITVVSGLDAVKQGWMEYVQQPVLPASLASVLLYFNIVLTPGGLMTAFLTQRGK